VLGTWRFPHGNGAFIPPNLEESGHAFCNESSEMLLTILGPTAAVELRVVPQTYIARLKAAYKGA